MSQLESTSVSEIMVQLCLSLEGSNCQAPLSVKPSSLPHLISEVAPNKAIFLAFSQSRPASEKQYSQAQLISKILERSRFF